MGYFWPPATEEEQESGWILCPDFLRNLLKGVIIYNPEKDYSAIDEEMIEDILRMALVMKPQSFKIDASKLGFEKTEKNKGAKNDT